MKKKRIRVEACEIEQKQRNNCKIVVFGSSYQFIHQEGDVRSYWWLTTLRAITSYRQASCKQGRSVFTRSYVTRLFKKGR